MRPTFAALAIASLSAPAVADFDYPDFSNTTTLRFVGNAGKLPSNELQVIPPLNERTGAAWHMAKELVSDGFTTRFTFQTFDGTSPPADGFAFVIQNDAVTAMGHCGGALGYGHQVGNSCTVGNPVNIQNAIAIEFDMYQNSGWGDPDSNHLSVHSGTAGAGAQDHTNSYGETSNIPTLADGTVHTVEIVYVPDTFSLDVYIDDLLTPALTVPIDIPSTIALDNGSAWLGFTGGTGGLNVGVKIQSWSMTQATGMKGSPDQISLNLGGTQNWTLAAGIAHASWPYLILGSASGTAPGTPIDGVVLPLNTDLYTVFSLQHSNSALLTNTFGFLDAAGKTTASFNIPGLTDPSLAGVTLHHAALAFNFVPGVTLRAEYASNPVAVQLVP